VFLKGDCEVLIDAVATVIKRRRMKLGLSQDELSEKAGIHRTYLSDMERGTRNPSLKSLESLARGLDTSISSLLFEAEQSLVQSTDTVLN
jgi:transcriptional regulator with XRE-family HTH domain